jgi:APA family basic amino acid/polyamine antiporter
MNKNFEHLFRKKDVQVILRETQDDVNNKYQLKRNLKVVDLTSLGIAAIIGAGIFSTIGNASVNGGPAVSLLFVFTAVACGFSAMCYARFASTVPVSGSAYTYAYVSFGELIAWIIGWDLIMEYAVGNIAVAISWSDYFTGLMKGLGMNFPKHIGYSIRRIVGQSAKCLYSLDISSSSFRIANNCGYSCIRYCCVDFDFNIHRY